MQYLLDMQRPRSERVLAAKGAGQLLDELGAENLMRSEFAVAPWREWGNSSHRKG
jgi:hypothetical protein